MPFSKDFLASFLDMNKIDALPTGAEMRVGGFIGQLESAKMYKLTSSVDPKDDPEIPRPDISRTYKTGNFGLYYADQSAARQCVSIVNPKAIINHMWLLRMPTAKLFNANKDKIVEGWGEQIFMELDIAGYVSKRAIKMHFLLVPSMVHAVAVGLGYDVPDFDVSPLLGTQVTVTDEFQARMVGNPDDTIEKKMSESYFGQQRTAIWKALGEDNPLVYTLDAPRSKYNATSEKMKKCLEVVNRPWTKGVLAKMATVTSPIMGDAYGSENKQSTVPIIVSIFESEAEAKAVAAAEAKKEEEGGEVSAKSVNGEPPVPESWADMKTDWLAALEEYKGMPKPKFIKAWDAAGNMGATSSEGWAWVEYLKQ